MSRTLPAPPTRSRDEYRFGTGESPVLQPGTMGWTSADLRDPDIRRLWDAGRYEIIEGVLTVMPATRFRGGNVGQNLVFLLRDYYLAQNVRCRFSAEVDIEAAPPRVVRADAVLVVAADLPKFEALSFDEPGTDWQDHPLTLPPTLVIESLRPGHELHDRRTKRRWYAEFGVRHYWLVDAYVRSLECLILEGGEYRVDAAGRGDVELRPPAFPGLVIPLATIWAG
jgi:Uma2 family endonuclease